MAKKDSKYTTIPYENTLYNLLIKEITGKYFQNQLAPHLIANFPEDPGIHLIENNQLSAWFPLRKKWGDIDLKEFSQYVEISKEQFEEYKRKKVDLSNIILAHKDAPIFKEGNKANLSEKISKVKYSTYPITDEELLGEKE